MVAGTNIEPAKFYDPFAISNALGITEAEQKRARDNGELNFTRKGRRILYRGEWLIDWLQPEVVTAS